MANRRPVCFHRKRCLWHWHLNAWSIFKVLQISGRRGRPPPTILLLRKLVYGLSYGIKIWTDLCHNPRVQQTERQTDGQTDRQTKFSSLDRVCIPCNALKITRFVFDGESSTSMLSPDCLWPWRLNAWPSKFFTTITHCTCSSRNLDFWRFCLQNPVNDLRAQLHLCCKLDEMPASDFVRYRVHKISIWPRTDTRTHGKPENRLSSAANRLIARKGIKELLSVSISIAFSFSKVRCVLKPLSPRP